MEKEEKRPRCSRCNSAMVYIRIRTKEIVCRNCGYVEKQGEKE